MGGIPVRRARRVPMGPPAPQIASHLCEAVNDLPPELIMETDGRERFSSATPEDILLAAETFSRCHLATAPIIRQSDLMEDVCFCMICGYLVEDLHRGAADSATDVAFCPPGVPFSR